VNQMNRGCGHMEKSLGYSEMALPYTQPQMLNGSDGMEFPLNLDIDSWFIDFDFMRLTHVITSQTITNTQHARDLV